MLLGVVELMCLGTIVHRVIVVYPSLYRGKSGECRLGSAGDQLDITRMT